MTAGNTLLGARDWPLRTDEIDAFARHDRVRLRDDDGFRWPLDGGRAVRRRPFRPVRSSRWKTAAGGPTPTASTGANRHEKPLGQRETVVQSSQSQ